MFKKFVYGLFLVLGTVFVFWKFDTSPANAATVTSTTDNQLRIASNSDAINEETYEHNIQGVTPISLNQYLTKADQDEKFIVFIGFKECTHCRKFSPIMKQFLQGVNQPIYYLDYGPTGSFKSASTQSINNFYGTFTNPMTFMGTPTVALVNHGKVVSMTVGDDTTLADLQRLVSDSINI